MKGAFLGINTNTNYIYIYIYIVKYAINLNYKKV